MQLCGSASGTEQHIAITSRWAATVQALARGLRLGTATVTHLAPLRDCRIAFLAVRLRLARLVVGAACILPFLFAASVAGYRAKFMGEV